MRDVKYDKHVEGEAHTVVGDAHVPLRVLHDAREASRFLLFCGKKLCGLLLLCSQRVEGGDLRRVCGASLRRLHA